MKAHANTIRITPRKARLVIDLIRGKDIKEAQAQCGRLEYMAGNSSVQFAA